VEVGTFAKINLFLGVVGKRPDGYHDIVSIMQTVGLCDNLSIYMQEEQDRLVTLETNVPYLPTGDSNLVVKAAKLLMHECKINCPVRIKLEKRIPIGAGLGGGSSNAAATLHGLNALFGLTISLDKLMAMGTSLGADVPFCLMGGTALAKGIGEELTPLPPHPPCNIVLACPSIHVSTRKIFSKLPQELPSVNVDRFLSAYETRDIVKIAQNFENTFTPITSGIYPQIANIITDLQNQGALGASMTGTGATVFAYFNDENNAQKACDKLQQVHKNTKFFVC